MAENLKQVKIREANLVWDNKFGINDWVLMGLKTDPSRIVQN